ncbi:hypothetical protein LOD99_329 [Oopsacas minuta]|uniref:WD repeat-containing protein 7 n=1 Tax=Oopsacas minuta TaxID=111878 RepID=A0AAV7K986_9METZ|nr:hypothetical protein LOD99_329 [Oopsacas minuta]
MSTVVPLVFWGNEPPSHHVTCCAISPSGQEVATGCRSGFICIWSLSFREFTRVSTDQLSGQIIPPINNYQAHAKLLLVGASEQISALCYSQDGTMLYSASSNGEIIRWDAKDGACTHQIILEGEHIRMKYMGPPQTNHLLLVFGKYSRAYLLDARTLDLAIILTSEEQPNWINAMLPLPLSLHQKETHVLAITAEPLIKIWDVPRLDLQSPRESYCKEEDKSRHTDYINVQHLTYWPKLIAQRLLVVGTSYFKVLGVRVKSQLPELCHVDCMDHMFSLSGGDFVDNEHIVVWSRLSTAHMYSFLPTSTEDKFEVTYLRCLQADTSVSIPMYSSWDLLHRDGKVLLVQANVSGSLLMWELDLDLVADKEQSDPPKTCPHYTTSLKDVWELLDKQSGLTSYFKEVLLSHSSVSPSHIPDDVMVLESSWVERDPGFTNNFNISSILYLPELAKVMCGLTNGYVIIFPLVKTLDQIVFRSCSGDSVTDDVVVLKAHRGRVTALLYPRQYSEQFNSKYIMTGGADGVVRVWDIENRLHLHCFTEHVGEVLRLKVCPKMTNTRLNCGVCSIGQDYSVAILSLSEFREVLLCGNHSAPVTHVRWKPAEDLMLIRCDDGRVYIWQMDTGVLDRVIVGHLAEEIITTSNSGGLSSGQRRDSLGVKIPKVGKNSLINTKNIASIKMYRSHQHDAIIPTLLIHMEPLIDQLTSSEHIPSSDKQVSKVSANDLELSSSPTRPSPYDRRQETAFFTRFLISCLHSWGMDSKLDNICQEFLKIRLPAQFGMSPQYGLLSKYSCISLYLPGWGIEPSLLKLQDTPISSFPLCYKWCLSPGLTTQHLLALTSLSYCCMNLYSRKQLRSSNDESFQRKLTACSQLNTLTISSQMATS